MSGDTREDREKREERALRVLADRTSARLVWHDHHGWVDLEIAASRVDPGVAVVQHAGSDPVLIQNVGDVARFFNALAEDRVCYPANARPCDSCGEVEHSVETCEAAEWDPTPGVTP